MNMQPPSNGTEKGSCSCAVNPISGWQVLSQTGWDYDWEVDKGQDSITDKKKKKSWHSLPKKAGQLGKKTSIQYHCIQTRNRQLSYRVWHWELVRNVNFQSPPWDLLNQKLWGGTWPSMFSQTLQEISVPTKVRGPLGRTMILNVSCIFHKCNIWRIISSKCLEQYS